MDQLQLGATLVSSNWELHGSAPIGSYMDQLQLGATWASWSIKMAYVADVLSSHKGIREKDFQDFCVSLCGSSIGSYMAQLEY